MSFAIDGTWLVAVVLVSIRFGTLVFLTPMDAMGRLPAKIKVLFSFALSALLVTLIGPDLSGVDVRTMTHVSDLARSAVFELGVGLSMAFGIYCAMGAFMVAGKILDFQSGFGAANVLNPGTNSNAPLIGTILSLMAVVLFFLTDAHHLLLKGFAYSLEAAPVGHGISEYRLEPLIAQFGKMFSFGLMLAAPAVVALLLADVGIAVMARTMPQMNVYFLFLPLKVFIGLMMCALSVRYMLPMINELFMSVFRYWNVIL